jgi:hypothetical protein
MLKERVIRNCQEKEFGLKSHQIVADMSNGDLWVELNYRVSQSLEGGLELEINDIGSRLGSMVATYDALYYG